MPRFLAACSLVLAIAFTLNAADWPQFLGPKRDSTTPEEVSPWTGDLKPLWKMPVGEAHSSPVVVDGIVYILRSRKGLTPMSLGFRCQNGRTEVEKRVRPAAVQTAVGNGPRSTPVVSGGKVFTFGGTGILACWNAKTGDVAWKVDTLKEFKTNNLFFGISTSPIMVNKDTVAVMVGGKGAGVVAFDVNSGKTVWQATDDPASYASPVLVNKQLVFLTGANLLGLSLTGEKLWSVPFKDSLNESSTTPVVLGDVVVGSSVTAGTIAVRVSEKEGKFSTEKVWDKKSLTCYFSTPVAAGDYLYMVNGAASLSRNATITLRCVEAKTGNVAWEKKTSGSITRQSYVVGRQARNTFSCSMTMDS